MSLMKVIDGATAGYLEGNATRNLKTAGAYGPFNVLTLLFSLPLIRNLETYLRGQRGRQTTVTSRQVAS